MPLDVVLVFVEPKYELNIGFMARLVKNFDFRELRCVRPRVAIGKDAYIFSAHAKDIVEDIKLYEGLEEAVSDADLTIGTTCKYGTGLSTIHREAITPEEVANIVVDKSVALVFGREDVGLTNEELKLCDVIATIPTNPAYRDLNVSHAAAVLSYIVFRAKTGAGIPRRLAGKQQRDLVMKYFGEVVSKVYPGDFRAEKTILAFKNLVSRADIRAYEASLLTSLFRRIAIRLGKERKSEFERS